MSVTAAVQQMSTAGHRQSVAVVLAVPLDLLSLCLSFPRLLCLWFARGITLLSSAMTSL